MLQRAPESLVIIEQLRKHALHAASKLAAQDDHGATSFGELWEAVIAVAAALNEAGVCKGDRIAFAMQSSIGYIALIYGTMAAGAIPCPLNIRLTPVELSRYLEPLAPKLIVCDADHNALVSALGLPVTVLQDVYTQSPLCDRLLPLWRDNSAPVEVSESDIALIIPTGGTTGVPKSAIYTHRSLYLFAASCCGDEGRAGRDVELFTNTFFHITIVTGWISTHFGGAAVRILQSFSPEKALAAIKDGATILLGVPTMFAMLRAHPDYEKIDKTRVRYIMIGGSSSTTDFIAQLIEDYPNALLRHSYGATEFGPVTVVPHEDMIKGRLSGVGRALPGVRISICDENLKVLPPGEVGEIVVSCPWQCSGYWAREEETRESHTGLGIRSGDLGRIDADGWITIAGRKKEMIITGGENVFPSEVEQALSKHPAIEAICVYGAKDAHWGERVEAAIVLKSDCDLTQAELVQFGRDSLGGYKLPKRIRIVESIPLTANQKPDRARLTREASA